ncbi:L,D-transpeptidase family protein [Alloacidobacterium dinghuense]|uniref:L,D-transpeptidase family protein n=1 Tax=Alloacidobacterium dinghuense TaxID=2763107 RepID=A0A7G8BIJ9_9BACT|nr:L,D-transpeptidase family protein [Alloacidobacterium dinghuense]QNI32369.1 L,D-transpeptidase family protein [Alloacidobacterium dinghuense]
MLISARRNLLSFLVLTLWLASSGCNSQTAAPPQPQSSNSNSNIDLPAVSSRLHQIADSGNLADLHWPNFTDYRLHFVHIYEASNFAPVWLNSGKPTPQALAVIQALQASKQKGLNPDDYDASRWTDRLQSLNGSPTPDTLARFDAALTVGVMRYISDLHIGRVNPKHFNFGIDIEQKKYDLPQFVTTKVINAANVQSVLDGVEPPYDGYRHTEDALHHYMQLADQGDGPAVPDVTKTISPGDAYPGVSQLVQRLHLFGDLRADTPVDANSPTYSGSMVDGVKTFQSRHGLAVTGKIDKDTIRQLNTPLAFRVSQLQDALERWRWLPPQFPQPPIVANIPEFIVRAYGPNQKVAFASNVVVGKALRTQTPVFANTMKYIVFRPYWNVPTGIVRGEIIPGITRDRSYISKKNFEVTDFNGKVITDGPVSDEVLAQLRAGKLTVRQKPGPTNSLGLIKLMFPNEYNVYLHSTPAQQLFSQSRRDFSHGCVRVEKPAELAAYVLRNQPPWTLEKVQQAMQSGPDNQQVNLTTPVPVLILYVTAVVEEDGTVHFFNDIYGYDKTLEAVLAKGQPYPG